MKTLLHIALGAAVSAAVLYALWLAFGPRGLVFGMPVLGIFAVPLVDLLAGYPRFVSRIVMRKVEGRYVEYRGMSLDIDIDERAVCWISTSDVRKLVPGLPAEPVLLCLYAGQVKQSGDPRQWRITLPALSLLLAKSTDPDNTRFAAWLEKDIARPARNRLERGMAPSR
jgi:hypothetical protein